MSIEEYLDALDAKVRELEAIVVSWSIQREIDTNLGTGFIKGRAEFIDGSRLEFSEQLPPERQKYRLHYMDVDTELLMRWDSAPHHKELSTFPFHVHLPQGILEHEPITLIQALDRISLIVQV